MAEELDFILATFERALRLHSRLPPWPPELSPEARERDSGFIQAFEAHAAAFRVTLVAREPPLDELRASALDAYAAVRQAYELRKPAAHEPLEPLPFDEEDARLAGM